MRGLMRGAMCLGLLLAMGMASTSAASATSDRSAATSCSNYAGAFDKFTQIKASGVSCHKAHEVLGTWANSAPGGTDLGFSCKSKPTKVKHRYRVTCTKGAKRITARETVK
jgi:hypothetical protein